MASSSIVDQRWPRPATQNYRRPHLQSFVAKKEAYFDAKAAHRCVRNADSTPRTVAPVSEETVREMQQMEKIHDSVLDAIHDALSKEALVKKLVLPFNETLTAATQGAASSRWEWQKNTALLELENRNQHLQHLLSQAGRDAMENELRAQEDRKILDEALQRGKEEALLLAKARDMRARLIEQMQVMARSKHLQATLCAWRHFCAKSRKKRELFSELSSFLPLEYEEICVMVHNVTVIGDEIEALKLCNTIELGAESRPSPEHIQHQIRACMSGGTMLTALRKAERMWRARTILRIFAAFIIGCEQTRQSLRLKQLAKQHRNKTLLLFMIRIWWRGALLRKEAKDKLHNFMTYWTRYRLRLVVVHWQSYCVQLALKVLNGKRAIRLLYFSLLRRAWRGWNLHVALTRETKLTAELFMFLRVARECLERWHELVVQKKQRARLFDLDGQQRQTFLMRAAMGSWLSRARLISVMATRLAWFFRRKERRTKWVLLIKWWHHVVKTRQVRTMRRKLKTKSERRCMEWAFQAVRKKSILKAILEEHKVQWTIKTRGTVVKSWLQEVRRKQARILWVGRLHLHFRNRRLQKLFSSWLVYSEASRRQVAEEKVHVVEERMKVLDTQLVGASQVRAEMEKLLAGFETERLRIMDDAGAAIARTPCWTSGFLDAELRWSWPSMEEKWLPPGRAGHSAVALPLRPQSPPCTVVFGGYNGRECYNDVLIFDCVEMCWRIPIASVALGSVCPPPMRNHTACPSGNNRMLLFGGFDGAYEFSDMSLLTFSDQGLSCEWSQPDRRMGARPASFSHHTACVTQDGKHMIVFGGYRSCVGHLNETWFLDLHLMIWTSPDYIGVPPSPRRGHGAAIIDKYMYVSGGYNGTEHLSDLHVLNVEHMVWKCVETHGDLPTPRRQHALTAVGRHLVIYGGYNGNVYLDDIYSLDTESQVWKRWPIMGPVKQNLCRDGGEEMQVFGRSMHTMVVAGQRLVIFGGVHERGALQDVLFLENAATVGGLQLHNCLSKETAKVHNLQANVVHYEQALQEKSMELALAHAKLLQLQSALKVEADKRTAAVEGQRVLLTKLQKARNYAKTLTQTCHSLEEEQGSLQKLVAQYEERKLSALQLSVISATQQRLW